MQKGLGGHRRFDPRNLNHLIVDHLKAEGVYSSELTRATIGVRHLEGFNNLLADERSDNVAVIREAKSRAETCKYYYDAGAWLDQGDSPMCTGFSGAHLLADGPVTQRHVDVELARAIYAWNQANDRQMGYHFPDGATSLALAKTLKQNGWITGYKWGYQLNDVLQALQVGPVLLGINWYSGMDDPSNAPNTRPIITATGTCRGGHEILCNGVDLDDGFVRLKNSWGREWGHKGHALLPFKDLEKLLADDGDALLVVGEVKGAVK